jgi:hypothetical protein
VHIRQGKAISEMTTIPLDTNWYFQPEASTLETWYLSDVGVIRSSSVLMPPPYLGAFCILPVFPLHVDRKLTGAHMFLFMHTKKANFQQHAHMPQDPATQPFSY